jgi:hypothetical protein
MQEGTSARRSGGGGGSSELATLQVRAIVHCALHAVHAISVGVLLPPVGILNHTQGRGVPHAQQQ